MIKIADGVYEQKPVNITHHRSVFFTGNCNDWDAVHFQLTDASVPQFWVQDQSIGSFSCLKVSSATSGASAFSGRQHVTIDLSNINFGTFVGGNHIALTEFSNATCGGSIKITGGMNAHLNENTFSSYNLYCTVDIPSPIAFSYFVIATNYATLYANLATFTGGGAGNNSSGVRCMGSAAIIEKPKQEFPGNAENVPCQP